jgi:hypothetical protein
MWLGVVLVISVIVSMFINPKTDMRGTQTVEISGTLQVQGLVVINLTIAAWLVYALYLQVF